MEGEGIIQNIKQAWLGKRSGYPPAFKKALKKHGSKNIVKMAIHRDPIEFGGVFNIVEKFANYLSNGGWTEVKQQLHYDKLFHLYAVLLLEDGTQLLLEKNEKLNLEKSKRRAKESVPVPMIKPIPLNDLILNTRNRMGIDKMQSYNAVSTNCQNFIINVLKANNLDTARLEKFIMQDVKALFDTLPYKNKIEDVLKRITGTKDRLNMLVGGGKQQQQQQQQPKIYGSISGIYM